MKIIYKVLCLCLLITACKMAHNEKNAPKKKANILEHTKWRASGLGTYDPDSILDFHTNSHVIEYITLNGKETTIQGEYKVKSNTVKIKWNKLASGKVSGVIIGKEMRLEDRAGLKTTKYYKISEY